MQLKVSIVLALCLVTVASAEDQNMPVATFGMPFNAAEITKIRQELNAFVDSIWVNHPDGAICGGCLIDHWHQNYGSAVARKFAVSQLNSALDGLPAEVTEKVKAIVFANKVQFEHVRHTISAPTSEASAHYVQYIGIARRAGNNAELAMLKAEVHGRAVQKYNEHRHRHCSRIMWWECCCHEWVQHIPRGFHAHEISMIETALRAEIVRRLKERANDITY